MKYKTFRSLVIASSVALVFGGGYAICSPSDSPPAALDTVADPSAAVEPVATPTAPSAPVAKPKAAADDYHAYLLDKLGKPASGDKIKDALRGSVKVNVYAKGGVWSRAKVDLDRDEKWDEKWWVDGEKVMRAVSGDDDENYGPESAEGTVQAR